MSCWPEINAEREVHGKKPFDDGDDPPKPAKKKRARRKKAGFKTAGKSTTDPDCGMSVKGKHQRQFACEAHKALTRTKKCLTDGSFYAIISHCVDVSWKEVRAVLSQLENSPKVVGAKQARRALRDAAARRVFLARDADPALTGPIEALSREQSVEVEWTDTMKQLGQACGIAVGAAVAVLL